MGTLLPRTVPPKRLGQSITSASLLLVASDILDWDGETDLTPGDFGSQLFAVLQNDTKTRIEIIEVDPATIADDTITILKRGLSLDGVQSEITANKLDWAANETIIQFGTDVPQLLYQYVDLGRDQVISGYKTVSTPVDDGHIATKKYVDDLVNGGEVSMNRVAVVGTAGETVTAGSIVYFKVSTAKWHLTDADDATTVNNVILGVCQGSGTNNNPIVGGVLIHGVDANQSGLNAGLTYYVSDTPGQVTSSPSTTSRAIGKAKSSTQLYFDPYFFALPTDSQKAALTGSSGTPSDTNRFVTQSDPLIARVSMTAGATINGGTLPVPLYQDTSTGKVLPSDGNDITKLKFFGFAITNSTDTNPITVQTQGVVGGFTSLSVGVAYYVQDAVGTIGTTPGTYTILVGIAISATQILIQKGRRQASGGASYTGTDISSAITTGFRPTKIRITAYLTRGTDTTLQISVGSYVWLSDSENFATAVYNEASTVAGGIGQSGTGVMALPLDGSNNFQISADTITNTGFTLTASANSSNAARIGILWEAEGEF